MHPALPANAIDRALTTSHQHLALRHGMARRYPAEVAPFAALAESSSAALADLAHMAAPDDTLFLAGPLPPSSPYFHFAGTLPALQMSLPESAPLPAPKHGFHVQPLSCEDAPAMLALIAIAFPGFFRPLTCRMGPYFGIRDTDGTLIAMGGDRLVLSPWHEVSGLCSHPGHAGRGLGSALLLHLLHRHRALGQQSFLHVGADNTGAISLYRRHGFQTVRPVVLHRLLRTPFACLR